MSTYARALATLDRPAVTSVPAGEQITGEVIANKGRDIKAILCSSRPGRDGITLDIAGATFRRGVPDLPLLIGHDLRSLPIGRVTDIHRDRRDGYDVLIGTLRFGSSTRAREAEADVRSGVTTDLSVGFDIPKGAREWHTGRAKSFLLTEASLVPVGLDESTIVIQRSYRRGLPALIEQEPAMDFDDVDPGELRRACISLLDRLGISFGVRAIDPELTRDADTDYTRAAASDEDDYDDEAEDESEDEDDDLDGEADDEEDEDEDDDLEDEDEEDEEPGERGWDGYQRSADAIDPYDVAELLDALNVA